MKESWIKVEDRLPSDERYVLVFDESGDYDIAWFSSVRNVWLWNSFDVCSHRITHWQPLEAPNKD